MEVIWKSEADEALEPALRLIVNDNGEIAFQYRSPDLPEWTDVDEVPMQFKFAI
jgi:hypothetical protein